MTSSATGQVLTEVRATVDPSHQEALVAGFEALLAEPRPDGMLRSELLHVGDDWRIQTLWRDHGALAAMRSSTTEPAAPRLFRSVGASPELIVWTMRASSLEP